MSAGGSGGNDRREWPEGVAGVLDSPAAELEYAGESRTPATVLDSPAAAARSSSSPPATARSSTASERAVRVAAPAASGRAVPPKVFPFFSPCHRDCRKSLLHRRGRWLQCTFSASVGHPTCFFVRRGGKGGFTTNTAAKLLLGGLEAHGATETTAGFFMTGRTRPKRPPPLLPPPHRYPSHTNCQQVKKVRGASTTPPKEIGSLKKCGHEIKANHIEGENNTPRYRGGANGGDLLHPWRSPLRMERSGMGTAEEERPRKNTTRHHFEAARVHFGAGVGIYKICFIVFFCAGEAGVDMLFLYNSSRVAISSKASISAMRAGPLLLAGHAPNVSRH